MATLMVKADKSLIWTAVFYILDNFIKRYLDIYVKIYDIVRFPTGIG